MSNLIDMSLTQEEMKEETVIEPHPPKYPYGLIVCLNQETLEKLGIKDIPAIGTEIHIVAKGEVTQSSQYEGQDGTRKSMDVQITDMAIANLSALDAQAGMEKMYPEMFATKKG